MKVSDIQINKLMKEVRFCMYICNYTENNFKHILYVSIKLNCRFKRLCQTTDTIIKVVDKKSYYCMRFAVE